jgi:predicted DNA-binding protein YlxM (UPF0122 family)
MNYYMEKTKLTRGEKIRREIFDKLERFITEDFGSKCQDHVEECVVCSTYKALNELQRNYGYKETN